MSNPGTGDDAVSEPVNAPADADGPVGEPVSDPVTDLTGDPVRAPVGDPEVPVQDAPPPPDTGPDRRLLLALAGGAAALVLLAAIVFVVSRRGGTNGDVATAPGTTTVTTKAPGTSQAPADFTDHGEIVKTIEVTTVPPPTTAPAPAAPAPAAPAAPTTTAKPGTSGGGTPSGGGANLPPPTVSITAGTNGSNVITGTITVPPGAGATCTLVVKLHANGALLGATGVACPGPINIGNLSWYTTYDVSVSATNSGGHADSNVVTVTVGGPPPLAAVIGNGSKAVPPVTQTTWPLLAEADVAKPANPAVTVDPGAQVTVLCQRRGPVSNGSAIYDYVQLSNGTRGWLEDSAVATTKAGDFDPALSQTCPPGV